MHFQDELRDVFKIPEFNSTKEENYFNRCLIKKKYQIIRRDKTDEFIKKLQTF